MDGARIRAESDFEQEKFIAWHIAAFQRQDKLISLEKFLGRPKIRQTVEEIKARAMALHEHYRGK